MLMHENAYVIPIYLLHTINRGSSMSAHVLLNSLSELGKEIKCEACRIFFLFFNNELNKFNNTRARMLDSIHHMTSRLL